MTVVAAVTRFGIKPEWREGWYRFVTGLGALLLAFGYLEEQEAALWTQAGISSVTLLFAALFAPGTARQLLYPLLAVAGTLLTWYGLANDAQVSLIIAAVAQMFGLATASAKVVQLPTRQPPATLAA